MSKITSKVSANSEPSQTQVQEVIDLFNQNRLREVVEKTNALVERFPNFATLYELLGAANSRLQRFDTAIENYKALIEIIPGSANALINLGNALLDNGDLDEAIESYQKAVKIKPDAAEAFINLGVALKAKGNLDAAIESYQTALEITPDFAEAHNNLGVALQDNGDLDEAIKSYEKALRLRPDFADTHNNLGVVLRLKGDLEAAIESYQKALEIRPAFAEVLSNISVVRKEQGDLDAAIESSQKALQIEPNNADAHNNLGNALQDNGSLDAAIESYQTALEIRPDFAEAHNNIGVALRLKGNSDAALESFRTALQIDPDYDEAYVNIGAVLKQKSFQNHAPGLSDILVEILRRKNIVGPRKIAPVAISLLKLDPIVRSALERLSNGILAQSLSETLSSLSKVPLLIDLMKVCPLPDLEIENLFKNLRSLILFGRSELSGNGELLKFPSALAMQCFTNEYIYIQSQEETEAFEELEKTIKETLEEGGQPDPISLISIASYKALHNCSWWHLLSIPQNLEELARRQIYDFEEESDLVNSIPTLQDITDGVSFKVREQYEMSPFPRWVTMELRLQSKKISEIAKEIDLKISDKSVCDIDDPQILIAGCGTGQHSIGTAVRFENCKVLAVDLSLNSLAYAKRKTKELGIDNIDYMQADILDLRKLGRKFDVIESSGVLHHMDDPMKGWNVLTDCLNPGGLMKIGLYSETARQLVARLRDKISQIGIGSSDADIKSYRDEIIRSNQIDHKGIAQSSDFYSLSNFRDLLFHVQEQHFNLSQLRNSLRELGMDFCGFELPLPELKQKFQIKYPNEEDIYDLKKWDEFEKDNPGTFGGMYQFWCQKAV